MSCKINKTISISNKCITEYYNHTPIIYYMHVHMYIHVNTCMYAKLDKVIMNVHIDIGTHTHVIMHTPYYAPIIFHKDTNVHKHVVLVCTYI